MPEEINEATAATTDAYVTLISFKVPDTFSVVLFQVTENGVNDIEYRIYGATDADFTSPQLIRDTTDVAAGANAFWVTGDPWLHMRVQIRSDVVATAGNVTVRTSGSAGAETAEAGSATSYSAIQGSREHDVVMRLIGGDLEIGTEDVETRSTSVALQVINTWTDMFDFDFTLKTEGTLLWTYIYLKYRIRATTGTADVDERVRARNDGGTWVVISDAPATANIGANWIERVTSGFFLAVANFNEVPFDFQVQGRTNEVNTLRIEVSSESYIQAVYMEV